MIQHGVAGQRGGAGVGRLLSTTGQAGGIAGLQAGINPVDIIDEGQIQKLAQLSTEINSIEQSTKNIWASIYSADVLERQKQSASYLHQLAESAKEIANAEPQMSWLQRFVSVIAQGGVNGESPGPIGTVEGTINRQVGPVPAYPPALDPALTPTLPAAPSPSTVAANYKQVIQYLGTAATAYEQYKAKVLDLDAAVAKNTITQDTYNRALTGLNFKLSEESLNAYIGALGQAAPLTALIQQAENRLTDARKQGAIFTAQETAGVLASVAANKQSTDTAILTTNNVVTAEQLRATKLSELNALVLQGKLTQDQANISLGANERVIRDVIEQQQVARSLSPQLTQLGIDATNLNKQFDTFATTSLNAVSPALQDMLNGTTTLSAGFQNLGLTVVKALENMIIQLTIIKPLAQALSSSFGSLFGGGAQGTGNGLTDTVNNPTGFYTGPAWQPGFSASTGRVGGMVGSLPSYGYVHPAYFDNAPRFSTGGMITDDGVPIVAHPGERILNKQETAAYNSAGGSVVMQPSFTVQYAGPAPSDPQDQAAHAAEMMRQFKGMMNAWAIEQQRPGGLLPRRQ